jgi:hypothetical protein
MHMKVKEIHRENECLRFMPSSDRKDILVCSKLSYYVQYHVKDLKAILCYILNLVWESFSLVKGVWGSYAASTLC